MSRYVRVKDPTTGHHMTVTQTQADVFGGQVLKDHDAVDPFGRPLPPKYNVNPKPAAAVAAEKKEA